MSETILYTVVPVICRLWKILLCFWDGLSTSLGHMAPLDCTNVLKYLSLYENLVFFLPSNYYITRTLIMHGFQLVRCKISTQAKKYAKHSICARTCLDSLWRLLIETFLEMPSWINLCSRHLRKCSSIKSRPRTTCTWFWQMSVNCWSEPGIICTYLNLIFSLQMNVL